MILFVSMFASWLNICNDLSPETLLISKEVQFVAQEATFMAGQPTPQK